MLTSVIYVHTSSEGLPWWAVIPLTFLGVWLAMWLVRGIVFLFSIPADQRLRRRIAEVHAAAGATGPYSAPAVEAAAQRLFADMHAAWDAGDRTRLQQISDPDLMADWARRLDRYQADGKRQRIKVVRGPKVQYVSLLADRGQVRVRIRAKVRRRFEPADGPRKEPRLGWSYYFEEFWTLARRGDEWILWSTRPDKLRGEYTTEPIVPPAAAVAKPVTNKSGVAP
jgi:predicted lipid-binding transport protein (Tim44 family)